MLLTCAGQESATRFASAKTKYRGKPMKISKAMAIAVGVVALAACNKKSPEDNQASQVQANAENQAENVTAAANNEAANIMNKAENKADAVKNEGKNEAAAIKNEGENKADAMKNAADNKTANKTENKSK